MFTPSFQEVRSHTVVSRRTRKGRMVQRVTRFGSAQVTGDIVPVGEPVIGDGRYCAFQLELDQIARGTFGKSGIALAKLADRMYGEYGLEPLLGTEVRGFAMMTPEPECEPLDGAHAARHHAYLTGRALDAEIDRLACPTAVYKVVTPSVKRRGVRLSQPVRLRKSERARLVKAGAMPNGRTIWRDAITGELVTVAEHALFIGHRAEARATKAQRKARTTRKARTRTIPADQQPRDVAQLEGLIATLRPAERVELAYRGTRCTVTVSPKGRVSATLAVGDDAKHVKSVRTATAAARQIDQHASA